jgi:hypothetical protein
MAIGCVRDGKRHIDPFLRHPFAVPARHFKPSDLPYGICQQACIEMKANCLDVPMLTRAQQFTCAAYFKVAHGNRVARAELCVLGNDFEPLLTLNGGI